MRTITQFRRWWQLMNEPTQHPQPLYQPFRDPVRLSPQEWLEAQRQRTKRYLQQHNLTRTQSRIDPQP